MKYLKFKIIFLLVLVILLIVTNPNKEQHISIISGSLNPLEEVLCESLMDYTNCGLVSICTDTSGEMQTFGILGMVFY